MTDTRTSSIVIRYAETDEDVVLIHRFLCLVAGPQLPGPIDHAESAREVWRVVRDDLALMAIAGGQLVGTLGIIRPKFWWGNLHFLANRWFFALPQSGAGRPLLAEARAIAKASQLELHIYDEAKQRLKIFNKSKSHVLR